jgi:hypothetical protein
MTIEMNGKLGWSFVPALAVIVAAAAVAGGAPPEHQPGLTVTLKPTDPPQLLPAEHHRDLAGLDAENSR